MLLRFVVENLFCFAEETVFSMVASEDGAHPEHIFEGNKPRVLRTSALYGANAHGKSKLVEAMALAQEIIINGSKLGQKIPVQPFRLDSQLQGRPSRFEFTFLAKGKEYTYGFVADTEIIHEEWLFSRPNKQEIRLFERLTDTAGKTRIDIGSSLAKKGSADREFLEFLIRGVRKNKLFLAEAVDRNFDKLEPVYNWFNKNLTIILPHQTVQPVAILAYQNKNFCEFIGRFLNLADTGISGINIVEGKIDLDTFLNDAPKGVRQDIEKSLEGGRIVVLPHKDLTIFSGKDGPSRVRLETQHDATDGNIVNFNLGDESSGTQRLLEMLPVLFGLDGDDDVTIIDELDRTLHPTISRLFVETFLKKNKTGKRQLIFTTHETSLLDLNLLRRDEIWFVEKDKQGKSHIYSLQEYGKELPFKIETGYLQGRFGAIPFIGDTSTLGW